MDVKALKGIAVVSIEQGEKVGTVDSMVFDLEGRKVLAFKLLKPGMMRSGRVVLKMEDVESIGKDAVMIQNKDRVRDLKDERDLKDRPDISSLSSLRVVTEDGTYVGNLATVQFDPKTGALSHIEITGGGFIDRLRRNQIVNVSDVISMGTHVVVIPDRYAPDKTEDAASEDRQETASEDKPAKQPGEILQ